MKVRQRHYGDSVEIDLQNEEFDYTIKTSGAKKRFSVDYLHFDPAVIEETEQSNTWWRNVGIAWLILGGVVTGLRYLESDVFRVSLWLYLGLLCLAVYRLGRVSFTHHATEGGGRILLMKDHKASSILEQLTSRRRTRLVEVYGEIDFEEDPEREIAKFKWLEHQGALSPEQAAARISAIRAAAEHAPEEAGTVN